MKLEVEEGDIIADNPEIKKTMRKYFENFYSNKLNIWKKWIIFYQN
jgi:hypothetical protein